ncbi:ABC transporter ATP-binding protein [Vallitalea pronyensis]|uniref:ABC transporter ATP-binding protein n=1 Tax=Vallitalea pronyensis TaxID=1348613 RepID=A0A8J8MNB8_9FIRM|nr:ABC transporter ATP-binding protein [Vallitalea pronyensis]QUI24606.1 ABC transporter ATP-binding protein [Vallitalea pronyensis]
MGKQENNKKMFGHGPGRGHGMSMPVEKAKNFKGTLKRLLGYLKYQRVKLMIVVLFTILGTLFTVVAPKILGNATTILYEGYLALRNGVQDPIDFQAIGNVLILLVGLYVISAIFNYIRQYIMVNVTQKTIFNIRQEVSEKLERLPLRYYDAYTHGEILSRVTNDIDNMSNALQQSVTQLISAVITILGVLVMMLSISPLMTLIALVTLPLSVFITKGVAKRSQAYFKSQQKNIGALNGHVEEMYTGHKIVKAFGYEEKAMERFDAINEELYEAGWKAQFISGIIMPMMTFVNNLGYVFVCITGGILMIRNAIKLGDIQAFIQYSRQFSQPIVQTANMANIIQSTIASAERVFELLDEEEEIPDTSIPSQINEPKGNVAFKEVDFGYKKEVPLINNMQLDVHAGQTVAIVGPTGAGKTTLVNLLMRFYELDSGKITVDGTDITKLKRSHLRQLFGMVLQDTWLFNGTIGENIAYGNMDATEQEIIDAAKAAHADHFIRTLPDGYDTILNEEASNISQGQKQLLTIARAILADPAILILDEATSSVDTRTEVYIQKAMQTLMKGRTSFVIAHRLSTIRDADVILVMNEGDIIEKGTHQGLIAQNGFYAELYNSQFMGSKESA